MKNGIAIIVMVLTTLPFAGCKKDTVTPYVGTWAWDAIILQLNSNNTYSITNSGAPSGYGKYAVTGTQLSFTDSSRVCPLTEAGVYSYTVVTSTSSTGGYYPTNTTTTILTLTLVSDSCIWRATNLPGPYNR